MFENCVVVKHVKIFAGKRKENAAINVHVGVSNNCFYFY